MVMVVSVSWPWPLDWIKFHRIGDKVLVLVTCGGGRAAGVAPYSGQWRGRGHRDRGDREQWPGAQQQHGAECEQRERET